ncbi:DUF6881 domain-containing protein [Paracidovorax anthurii]|uniref:DUF6881 domain-containing protein n=1 Tax=Paracidovorax anthurii TaxID=78229 RepID=A0A328YKQ9_9BURK|nr:hypothetical protein [Paracidovorax anthurii]RAR70716.1 hypothetical protein AX018_11133 [Paracidovorax anthurii]
MNYLKVRWNHANPNDPVLLMSELDADRYEVRKVEVFADKRLGFAGKDQSSEKTILGEKPVPSASDIAADSQFVVETLDAEEFEKIWLAAVSGSRWQS